MIRILLFLFISCAAVAQSPLTGMDSVATADVPPRAPGIATAIVQKADVVYERYAGYANLADSILISRSSRFNIASNGKQFTALATLLLESQKKISLQDDIRKYFPELFKNIKDRITIESLINHSSGIRDVYDLLALQGKTWWKFTLTNADLLQLLKKQNELNFTPGSQYLYSNSNYILLALLIEKVSGESFVQFTSNMFAKLGMYNTSFEDDYTKIKQPVALPYFNFSTWSNYEWIWNGTGDGNLFSTLPDLIRWEKIVHGWVRPDFNRALIQKSLQLTSNPSIKNYGFGLEFKSYKGISIQYHEGATGAWKAVLIRIPEKELSFITLTNSGKVIPSWQTYQMVDKFLNLSEDGWPVRPAAAASPVSEEDALGIYAGEGAFYFHFLKNSQGEFVLRRQGRNDVKLERESANVFRQVYDTAFKQEFLKNDKGEMTVTAYYTSHAPYTLTRARQTSNITPEKIHGRFMNTETGAIVILQNFSNEGGQVVINGQKSTGIFIAPGKLVVDDWQLTFDVDKPITELLLNGNRLRRVRFKRSP